MKIWHVVLKCGMDSVGTAEKIMWAKEKIKEDVTHGDGTCGGTGSSPLEKESIHRCF